MIPAETIARVLISQSPLKEQPETELVCHMLAKAVTDLRLVGRRDRLDRLDAERFIKGDKPEKWCNLIGIPVCFYRRIVGGYMRLEVPECAA